MSRFCKCKSYSHFFSKSISIYAIFNDRSFNNTLTNNNVGFAQLGPGWQLRGLSLPWNSVSRLTDHAWHDPNGLTGPLILSLTSQFTQTNTLYLILLTNSADDKLMIIFLIFSLKIGFNISYKFFPQENLIFWEKLKKYFKMPTWQMNHMNSETSSLSFSEK